MGVGIAQCLAVNSLGGAVGGKSVVELCVMGQHSSRLSSLRRAIKDNQPDLTQVRLNGIDLTDKTLKKLAETLKKNQYASAPCS